MPSTWAEPSPGPPCPCPPSQCVVHELPAPLTLPPAHHIQSTRLLSAGRTVDLNNPHSEFFRPLARVVHSPSKLHPHLAAHHIRLAHLLSAGRAVGVGPLLAVELVLVAARASEAIVPAGYDAHGPGLVEADQALARVDALVVVAAAAGTAGAAVHGVWVWCWR